MKTSNFNEVADEWLEFHRAKVKKSTYDMYNRYAKYLKDEFGDYSLIDITPIIIQKYLNQLHLLNFAKSTISKYRLTLQLILKYGIRNDLIVKNACEDTYVPKNAKVKKVGCISDTDIKMILDSYNCQFGLFPLILLTFGLRKSEALALTWEDINIEKRCIFVNKIIEYDKSTPVVCNCLKNGDEERVVPILPMVYHIFNEFKKNNAGIIFSRNGEYLKRSRCEKEWNKYLKSTNLQMNKHQLRHTYATMLYKSGVDMKTAMMLLGHKDMAMLIKIYTHTDMEMLTLSIDTLNKYMEDKFQVS